MLFYDLTPITVPGATVQEWDYYTAGWREVLRMAFPDRDVWELMAK